MCHYCYSLFHCSFIGSFSMLRIDVCTLFCSILLRGRVLMKHLYFFRVFFFKINEKVFLYEEYAYRIVSISIFMNFVFIAIVRIYNTANSQLILGNSNHKWLFVGKKNNVKFRSHNFTSTGKKKRSFLTKKKKYGRVKSLCREILMEVIEMPAVIANWLAFSKSLTAIHFRNIMRALALIFTFCKQ